MGENYHFYDQAFSWIKKTKETESVLIKAAYIAPQSLYGILLFLFYLAYYVYVKELYSKTEDTI